MQHLLEFWTELGRFGEAVTMESSVTVTDVGLLFLWVSGTKVCSWMDGGWPLLKVLLVGEG